uniref:Conotoxin Cal6.39 n=1 Tax=Californiconus californicus TaxID=1736779 RepID=C639_CONCL|nr:RecName: Full=Conotoxin Cal6.39; AltName: Full=O3_cal6.3; Flags: Precursor [Californiconus californicus]
MSGTTVLLLTCLFLVTMATSDCDLYDDSCTGTEICCTPPGDYQGNCMEGEDCPSGGR